MKTVVILQSNYLPWKGYFDLIHSADQFIFYDEVKYTKNDWRNRNKIYTPNGLQWLTIPISKDAVNKKISEIKLENPEWQMKHYKQIYYGYKRARYFNQLEHLIHLGFIENEWKYLKDVNRFFIIKISEMLKIKTVFTDSITLKPEGDRIHKLINLLKHAGAEEYISGPTAKDYLNGSENLFAESGIKLSYKTYPDYPEYAQLCPDFIQQVSIIDLLANIKLEEIPNFIWNF